MERPLHIGADLAGRYSELAPMLSAYGDPVGEAFQLRDDVLDLFGDETLIGKPIGGDRREGKPTALLAATVERCPAGERLLLARVGHRDLTDSDIDDLRDLVERCGARAAIDRSIADLTERASGALVDAPTEGRASEARADLATFVATRQH